MIKLSINKKNLFLPLSSLKGTTEQRFQRANVLNLRFFRELQDEFINREVKPSTFKRTLKETAGTKLKLEILKSPDSKTTEIGYIVNDKGKIQGYSFRLPLTYWTENIRQSDAISFLKETQKMFNEVCNPKILTREISLFNKGQEILSKAKVFYMENIAPKQMLKEKSLDKFLKNKKPEEQIDILQFLRYRLMYDKNLHQAEFNIDKHIEKFEKMQIMGKNYDLTDYRYDDKLAIINKKLLSIIRSERGKA